MNTLLAASVLFSEMRPDSAWRGRFDDWYDTEHIPLRMGVKGFLSAQRYHTEDKTNYLAVYELDSLDVFNTPAFKAVKNQPSETTAWMLANVNGFTRYLCDQIAISGDPSGDALNAPVLHAILCKVRPDAMPEFDSWHSRKYVPQVLRSPNALMVRSFAIASGEPQPFNRLTLHYHAAGSDLSALTACRSDSDWFLAGRSLAVIKKGNRQVTHC